MYLFYNPLHLVCLIVSMSMDAKYVLLPNIFKECRQLSLIVHLETMKCY